MNNTYKKGKHNCNCICNNKWLPKHIVLHFICNLFHLMYNPKQVFATANLLYYKVMVVSIYIICFLVIDPSLHSDHVLHEFCYSFFMHGYYCRIGIRTNHIDIYFPSIIRFTFPLILARIDGLYILKNSSQVSIFPSFILRMTRLLFVLALEETSIERFC